VIVMANGIRPDLPTKLKLADARLRARMGTATLTLARLRAIKAAKQQLHAQGAKPDRMHRYEIVALGEAYLAAHGAELIAEAKQTIERWQAEGFFGKRAKLNSCAQNAEA
jgi:hypothetical protein